MQFLKSLLEMTRDEHEAEVRNAYGSLGHPKAQSALNDFDGGDMTGGSGGGGGVGGGYSDEYTSQEWAGDWVHDHMDIVTPLIPLAQQSNYDVLEHELMKAFSGHSRSSAEHYAACVADYLIDNYGEDEVP